MSHNDGEGVAVADAELRASVLAEAVAISRGQPGGTLATLHTEDGTPYVTFVFFHMTGAGEVIFGSGRGPQHTRNILGTPEVSFLIDNREIIGDDWMRFDRIVVEGSAKAIPAEHPRYPELLEGLREKNPLAARFTEQGILFCVAPRRLILRKGVHPDRHVLEFAEAD